MPKTIKFDEHTLLDLLDLQERILIADRAIRRRVAQFASDKGIDPEKNNLTYDVLKKQMSYEPIKKETKDESTQSN